jgi:hypothetical protein
MFADLDRAARKVPHPSWYIEGVPYASLFQVHFVGRRSRDYGGSDGPVSQTGKIVLDRLIDFRACPFGAEHCRPIPQF